MVGREEAHRAVVFVTGRPSPQLSRAAHVWAAQYDLVLVTPGTLFSHIVHGPGYFSHKSGELLVGSWCGVSL